MAAIFGFSGWSGKKSRAMAEALSHRGNPPARTHASIRSTACWLPSRSNHGGIIEHRGQVVALAGRLFTDQKKTHMAPLLRSYREKGLGFVQDLRGAYVLAVLDEDGIHLARDPAGLRTIYYGLCNDRFIFAVEPRGILAWSGFARKLRPAAVAQYLSYGFVPGSGTMLENLWELPPGHTVTFAQGKLGQPRCFCSPEQVGKEERSGQEWQAEFTSLHGQALADQLPVHGSVGLFLSGGLSSGAIAVEARRQCREKLPSWSIRFSGEHQGRDHARALADYIGTEHREIQVQPKEFLERLDQAVFATGEPLGDPSLVFMSMLSAVAAEEVEYVLNGAGGSLVFGGTHMLPVLLRHWYGGIEQGLFFREQAYLSSCCGAYDELNALLTPEWRSLYNTHEALEGPLLPFFQADRTGNFLDKLSRANIHLKGGHMQLPLMERMIGAYGVTSLSPLFDERLIALSFRMPSALKLARGMGKRVIRQAYSPSLPNHFIERAKSGVEFPSYFWRGREWKKYARKILRKRVVRKAGIFNPERVEELLALTPEQSLPQHERTLWLLITFELWRQKVLNEKL
ncbi:MAG: asparagine synthase-related protein [Candidatus Electrothrix sp. GW3-4]|uniref:asparagine synthetase B family protein n=1 Tax=Candidatus Electrothrix sp. GW3-4 TaxID=3126740 RepID=UPI0030CBECCF